jgi:hypothetical protein
VRLGETWSKAQKLEEVRVESGNRAEIEVDLREDIITAPQALNQMLFVIILTIFW